MSCLFVSCGDLDERARHYIYPGKAGMSEKKGGKSDRFGMAARLPATWLQSTAIIYVRSCDRRVNPYFCIIHLFMGGGMVMKEELG